jgi:hypothetical protein
VTTVAATDVAPITVTGNQPPTGSAQGPYVGMVNTAIAIAGTASDPDNDPLTTAWTVSGPGSCTIAAPDALATAVTCDTPGAYTLTLTISDGVNPAVSVTGVLTVAPVLLPPTL